MEPHQVRRGRFHNRPHIPSPESHCFSTITVAASVNSYRRHRECIEHLPVVLAFTSVGKIRIYAVFALYFFQPDVSASVSPLHPFSLAMASLEADGWLTPEYRVAS